MSKELGRSDLKTLYIMEILLERTDQDHGLNASQLIKILHDDYEIDLSDRRTIYTEINKLKAFDIDILKQAGSFGGYYVTGRQFELPELKLLVDAVQSSRFITEKKSQELIKKLESLCSQDEAKQLKSQVVIFDRPKASNETIYYSVDMLHTAIFQNRRITFQYVEWTAGKELAYRHEGALYDVSPLHLIWNDENYYLIGFDESAGKVKHYRVDKMRNMNITGLTRSREAIEQKVDLAAFSKKTFGMYGGEDTKVQLLCRNYLAGVIVDRFGSDIWMTPRDDQHFLATVMVTVSPQFYGWVTGIGEGIEIVWPETVREGYEEHLHSIIKKYSGT